ncbi:MAG: beta-propeller fold lactonase family protein [Candidatus Sulfotelmatobacter sp.]
MSKVRALLSLMVVLLMASLLGCSGHYTCGTTFGSSSCTATGGGLSQGGSGTSGDVAVFDFFFDSGQLDGASLDTAGVFSVIPNFVSPPQVSSGIGGMVIVQKQWLYISFNGSPEVEGYSIDGTTGALTAITGGPFVSPDTNAMASDPAGKFLFLLGADADEVSVFTINQTGGALTLVGTYPVGVGFAEQVTTDGLGKFLYVTAGNLGGSVAVFSIGSTGALTPAAGSPFAISIAQLKGEPSGKFLLGVTGNGANNGFASDNHVYVYSINQTSGVITPAAGSPFATTYTPSTLTVHPSGSFVYTFNQTITGTSPTEGFQFNTTTGALTEVTGSPFTALTAPAGQFDQSGLYLFMHPSTSLSVASVNTTTGALTSISSPITSIGSPVGWAVTDPN